MFEAEQIGAGQVIRLDLTGLDATGTLEAVAEAFRWMVDAETRLLQLALHWADLHSDDTLPDQPAGPGRERPRLVGGDGTPLVAEFAAAELGAMQ